MKVVLVELGSKSALLPDSNKKDASWHASGQPVTPDFHDHAKTKRKSAEPLIASLLLAAGVPRGGFSISRCDRQGLAHLLYDVPLGFPDPRSIQRFNAVDLVCVHGSKELDIPWASYNVQVIALIRQCLQFGKPLLALGSGAPSLAHVLASGGKRLHVLNGGGAGSFLRDVSDTMPPQPDAGDGVGVFLDWATGDCLTFNSRNQSWESSMSVGLQRWDKVEHTRTGEDRVSSSSSVHRPRGLEVGRRDEELASLSSAGRHQCPGAAATFIARGLTRWRILDGSIASRMPTYTPLATSSRQGTVAFSAGMAFGVQCGLQPPHSVPWRLTLAFLEKTWGLLQRFSSVGLSCVPLLHRHAAFTGGPRTSMHVPAPGALPAATLLQPSRTQALPGASSSAAEPSSAWASQPGKAGGVATQAPRPSPVLRPGSRAFAGTAPDGSGARGAPSEAEADAPGRWEGHPLLSGVTFGAASSPLPMALTGTRVDCDRAQAPLDGDMDAFVEPKAVILRAEAARRARAQLAASIGKGMSISTRRRLATEACGRPHSAGPDQSIGRILPLQEARLSLALRSSLLPNSTASPASSAGNRESSFESQRPGTAIAMDNVLKANAFRVGNALQRMDSVSTATPTQAGLAAGTTRGTFHGPQGSSLSMPLLRQTSRSHSSSAGRFYRSQLWQGGAHSSTSDMGKAAADRQTVHTTWTAHLQQAQLLAPPSRGLSVRGNEDVHVNTATASSHLLHSARASASSCGAQPSGEVYGPVSRRLLKQRLRHAPLRSCRSSSRPPHGSVADASAAVPVHRDVQSAMSGQAPLRSLRKLC